MMSSFSQHMTFERCPRMWFYKYVKKLPVISDMMYAYAGSVLHDTIDFYYKNGKDIQTAKEFFKKHWIMKKLPDTKLRMKEDAYWLMALNAFNLKKELTTTELKIFFQDVVGYLDGVNTNTDEIVDWKSSTRRKENEEEYKKQIIFYSYLYYIKMKKLPKKAIVYYLKYIDKKGELSFNPTMDDIEEIEDWYYSTLKKMEVTKEIPSKVQKCFMFCPFVNICFDNNENVLKYTLHKKGNYIFLDGSVTSVLDKAFNKKFSYELKNAYFIKRHNPSARTVIGFWKANNRSIPIGFVDGVVSTLKNYAKFMKKELAIDIKEHREFDETKVKMPDKFINDVTLRDYQDDAVNAFMRKKIGVLQMGTGSGKTEVAVECIRRLGVKTLFIVDKVELLKQTKERIEKSLGIDVGQVGYGVTDIKDITVATIQTLVKQKLALKDYLKSIRFVVFDECHKTASRSFWTIAHYLINTEYRLGLSGTARRDDGNDMMINATTGYIIHNMSCKLLIDKGWLVKPKLFFIESYMTDDDIKNAELSCKQGLINETDNYPIFYKNFISENVSRNKKISEVVEKNKGKKILILTKLIEHGILIKKSIPGSEHLYGETNKEERKRIFDDFKNGGLNVLISTISIFSEGVDIVNLEILINAGANRGDIKTIQMLGRILRKMKEDKEAKYFDFIDESKFFRGASFARKQSLIKEGHEIEIINNIP